MQFGCDECDVAGVKVFGVIFLLVCPASLTNSPVASFAKCFQQVQQGKYVIVCGIFATRT